MALATHLLRRSLLTASPRATAFTPSSSSTRALLLTPTTKILSSQQQSRLLSISARARAANPQAGGPTSKDAGHAAKNIKEEAAAVGSSIASAIGGRSGMTEKKSGKEESGGSGMSAILEDAKTIGGEMAKAVPQPALIWGAAGIIPYVSTAAASIWLARQAKLVSEGLEKSLDFDTAQALLIHAQNLQLTYGAVILSFLGAIHWGFEFSKYGGTVGNWRYAMGVLPVAVAWPSLLLTPQLGLITQWGAFVAIWFFDLRATQRGWVPGWYSTYRFWLTAFVGGSIILTLAGTQYYDTEPTRSAARGAGARLEQNVKQDEGQKIQLIHKSAEGDKGGPRTEIKGVESEVVSKSGGEDGDSWVKVENPKKQEEERKKKEEEEKKKEEEQKNKDKEQKEEADKQTDKSE